MKSAILSFCLVCFTLSCYAQKFNERYMYLYHAEDSSNPKLISKERYNKKGKVVFAEYFSEYFDDIDNEPYNKGKYYYKYKDTSLVQKIFAGYAYQFDVWGNVKWLDSTNYADSNITDYTYEYDSMNRIVNKTIAYRSKSGPGPNVLCAWSVPTEEDSLMAVEDEAFMASKIQMMNHKNEGEKNKHWNGGYSITYAYKYEEDEPEPVCIESIYPKGKQEYTVISYNRNRYDKLISKVVEIYHESDRVNNYTLSSVTHTQYTESGYTKNYIGYHYMDPVIFTDTTITLRSHAVTYQLDAHKRIIDIHNKDGQNQNIHIYRRKDGNILKIVQTGPGSAPKYEKYKTTMVFRYK